MSSPAAKNHPKNSAETVLSFGLAKSSSRQTMTKRRTKQPC